MTGRRPLLARQMLAELLEATEANDRLMRTVPPER